MIDAEKTLDNIIEKIQIIDADDIPSIDLYMDQVTTFMDNHLGNNKRFEDDKVLTKTMINNYAKNDLLPAPKKKRYTKDHVIMLTYIYYMKNFLSINDIKTLLKPISERYFDGNNKVSMEEIYKTLSNSEEEMTDFIKSDIIREINKSKEMFLDNPKKDTDYLQLFALVTGLTYDIYVKKQMIESIVDQINKYEEKTSKDKRC